MDVFLPSQAEAEAFTTGQSVIEIAEKLAACGLKFVIVKRGRQGAYVYNRSSDTGLHVPAIPARVVDVTGAGDAFCGGFVAVYVDSGDVAEAAWRGAATASMAIEGYGALHLLHRERAETERRIERFKGEQIA